jgi:hypothetical protein
MAVAMAISVSVSAQAPSYRGRLSVVPLDIQMQSSVAGAGTVTATVKGTTLTVNGTFSGLRTPATDVRVHRSAKPGMRGAPIGNLTATSGTTGTISGSIELTREQIDDLAAGRLYVQLHSQKAPNGNLWGWLFATEKK